LFRERVGQILPRTTEPHAKYLQRDPKRLSESLAVVRQLAGIEFAKTTGYNEPMSGSDDLEPTSPGLKLTYDDFVLFPDDGQRHELIDGEHYVTPSPNIPHQRILGNLHALIWSWLEAHPVGQVLLSPLDVVLTRFDVVEPDLLYFSNERAGQIVTPQNLRGAPELVVEIASPGTRRRDETIKRRLFERAGVSEYWIVDPDVDVVRVYRREPEGFGRATELSRERGDVLTTPLLPGLDIPLSRMFRE
jgi:Uma2 family endonuclease